jgi:PTH1 family peptidyl-tRNA hydrolase
VESIINELGTQDFVRFRIGVGKPVGIDQKEFVLDKPREEEKELFEKSINTGQEAVLYALDAGLEKAMNKYNSN